MDAIVFDEVARLYPANVSSELENQARIDIIDWILTTPTPTTGMDMKDVIKLFWNERLGQ